MTASTPAPREPLDDASGDADREASLPASTEDADAQSTGASSGVEDAEQKATPPKPRAPRPRAPRKTAAQRAAEASTSTPESAIEPPASRPTTTSTKKRPAKRPAARTAAGDTKPRAQGSARPEAEPKVDDSARSPEQGVQDPEISTIAAPGPPPPLPVAPPVFVVPPPPPLPPRPPLPDLTGPETDPAEQETDAAESEVEGEPAADPAPIAESAPQPQTEVPGDSMPVGVTASPAESEEAAAAESDEAAAAESDEAVAEPGSLDALAPEAPETSALLLRGVGKVFGGLPAVDGLDLEIPAGSFYGLVGPNGAGKTTTLSMMAGLLRPDAGTVSVCGVDAAREPVRAKKMMGVLPDRLRTFDRLTGRQLLYYYGVLRGLAPAVVHRRIADLARAFDLTDSLGRTVADYSAGMTKKVMLAGALIHSPRVLVLDEPFEAVDPVSSEVILDILRAYVEGGGTVVLSSHGMALVERVCDRVAVIVGGRLLAEGTVAEVRGELTLEQRFVELSGGIDDAEGLEWLHTFSG